MASQRSGSSSPSSGDHYNSEMAGPPVGRCARGTWTANLDYVQKTLHLGAMLLATQDGQNEYARDKRSGLLVPLFAGCYTTPRRSRPKHHRPDLFAPRYASMLNFCQPRAPHLTASLCEQPAQASVPPLHLVFGASDQLGVMPQGIHTGIESPRLEARCAGPALCQLLRNSAEEPTQASTTRLARSALCLLYTSPSPRD